LIDSRGVLGRRSAFGAPSHWYFSSAHVRSLLRRFVTGLKQAGSTEKKSPFQALSELQVPRLQTSNEKHDPPDLWVGLLIEPRKCHAVEMDLDSPPAAARLPSSRI
jgi:hypothetical protein